MEKILLSNIVFNFDSFFLVLCDVKTKYREPTALHIDGNETTYDTTIVVLRIDSHSALMQLP